ncbi:MAG: cache domain-containing protein, partial [Spirochaetaceae bacterium]|nr:cache domain-containing protein [Spirochaetaceae bacterium]
MKKKFFSLGAKEVVFIVAPLVIVAIVICVAWGRMLTIAINVGLADQSRMVGEKVAYEARITSESPVAALESLADAIKSNPNKANVTVLLKSIAAHYPQCIEFYYSTATPHKKGGWLITNNDWNVPDDFEHAERPWFTGAAAANGKLFYGEPFISQPSGKLCISYSIAVYSAQNEFLGVAACDLLLTNLEEAVANIKFSENSRINIVDSNGRYLTHKDPSYVLAKNYFDETNLDKKSYNAKTYLDGTQKAFVKDDCFFSVKQIENSSWFAIVEGPVSDFSSRLAAPFYMMILVTVLLILGIVVFNGNLINSTRLKEAKLSEQLISETQNLFVAA